jgi:radical SAM superfamily enzyme YgiQ (UPF0313 family)
MRIVGMYRITENGPEIPVRAGIPGILLLNANPFAEGIANLGAQVVAWSLLEAGFNIWFGFADMPAVRHCGAGLPPPQVVAVSVPFEDTYHHVPRMLRESGVSPWPGQRDEADPVVIVGGMSLINPMPLAPFFDAMVIGEGREAVVRIGQIVAASRRVAIRREEILHRLAAVPNVFVPSLYNFEYDANGSVIESHHDSDARAVIEPARPIDMDRYPIHSIWTTEHACYKYPDYYSIMVAMGCHLKCPFCVVGNVQGEAGGRALNIARPTIVDLALRRREEFGTNLIKLFFASSFSSRAAIDPLNLKSLLATMLAHGFECRVGSLNIRQADAEILDLVRRCGQARVTFAPETGGSLRQSVGKPYSRDDKLIQIAGQAGPRGLGLDVYTMLGVPGEEPSHVRELACLIADVRAALDRRQSLEVSINPAFSKAQTPYERRATIPPEETRARFAYLRGQLPDEDGIEWVTVIDDPMAYYQPILALGGPELAPVLDRMSRWFAPGEASWRTAVAELVPGGDRRYFRDRDPDEVLPWQHITYTDHQRLSLRLEAHRARAAKVSAGVA